MRVTLTALLLTALAGLTLAPSSEAGTCTKTERYCTEWLDDGKCKLWDSREVEVICGSNRPVCSRTERYCTEWLDDGKCRLWDSREVEYPC